MNTLISTLRGICGQAHVLTHDDPATDLSAWEQDWRKRAHGRALAVVRPGSTAEVAAVVDVLQTPAFLCRQTDSSARSPAPASR